MPIISPFQFQGKWYTLGWAENSVWNESQSQPTLHSTTYELKDDHSYNVTSTWLSSTVCEHRIRTFVLRDHDRPGQYTVANIKRYRGLQSYTMRVAATDYNTSALVFFKMIFKNNVSFETTLYGRTKELSPELKERFVNFAKSLGFTEDNIIFTDPTGSGPHPTYQPPGFSGSHRGDSFSEPKLLTNSQGEGKEASILPRDSEAFLAIDSPTWI
ncbi:PREDICTED: neutrophil gelatinase-associated lipocalin-like [Chinchilla lanigera]|uniref:neutrophil gelatinase-associated lipocalin-like n=1 Tax=Chinchilla lanigera TaxID=34839 RepID=UPI000697FA05|nr:PREDICTED: neutrophil gelatinase-associated lipocalin-like [Chinchilla lanigera]